MTTPKHIYDQNGNPIPVCEVGPDNPLAPVPCSGEPTRHWVAGDNSSVLSVCEAHFSSLAVQIYANLGNVLGTMQAQATRAMISLEHKMNDIEDRLNHWPAP